MKFIRTRKPFSWIAAAPPKPEAAKTGAHRAAALGRKRKRPRQYARGPLSKQLHKHYLDLYDVWKAGMDSGEESAKRKHQAFNDAITARVKAAGDGKSLRSLAQHWVFTHGYADSLHDYCSRPSLSNLLDVVAEADDIPNQQAQQQILDHVESIYDHLVKQQTAQKPDWRPDETLPEDYYALSRPRKYALSPNEANKRQERFDRWMQWWFQNSGSVHSSLRELERHPDANIRGLAQSIYDPPSDELLHPPDFTLPTGILADLLEDMGHPHAQLYRDWYEHSIANDHYHDEPQQMKRPRRGTPRHGPVKLNRPRRYNKQLPRPEEVLPQLRALEPLPPQSRYEQSALYQELSPQPGEHGGWFWQPTGRTYNARYDDVPMLPHVRQGGLVLAKHISSQVRHPEIARRLLTYIYHKNIPNKLFGNHAHQEIEDIDPALAKMVQEYLGSTAPYSEGFYKDWEGLTNAHDTAGIMADYADDIGQEAIARRAREDWHRVNREVDETIQNTPYLREQRRKYAAQQVGRRAPPGGIIFRGLHYPGGQYMPSKRYLAQLSKHDKLALPRAAGPWSHLS